ncbi:MAG: ribbon-helix-helix protein, CopG family [Anaerolineales bacterium]
MAAKKLISARVSKKTDEQITELAETRGETKSNIIALAIDREYEKYRLEQQETTREEAVRKELELRLRDIENELIALKELRRAANNVVEMANKLDKNLDLKTLQSLQSDMAKAIQAFEIMKEE